LSNVQCTATIHNHGHACCMHRRHSHGSSTCSKSRICVIAHVDVHGSGDFTARTIPVEATLISKTRILPSSNCVAASKKNSKEEV
jgi:hypothetical protein